MTPHKQEKKQRKLVILYYSQIIYSYYLTKYILNKKVKKYFRYSKNSF